MVGVIAATLCSGQQAADADKTASFAGLVNNALTGEPMVRAHVALRGTANGTQKQYGATTTAEGKFSITGISPGRYQVSVDKVGFVMAPGSGSRASLNLQEKDKKEGYQVKLLPTGAIVGRVMDAEGEPVEGASVSTEGGMMAVAQTDERGFFRIGGLAPGKYRLKAVGPGAMPVGPEHRTDGTEEAHYVRTYYPGVISAKEAAMVEVRPNGEASGADIRLARFPWVRVSGRVIGLPENFERAIVIARTLNGFGNAGTSMVKPDGSFEIWRIDPGKALLSANLGVSGNRLERTPEKEIEVGGANLDGIELRVVPDADLAGRVEFEDEAARQLFSPPASEPSPAANNGQPARNQAAGGQQPRPRKQILLQNVSTYSGAPPAPIDETGVFLLKKVPAGKYRVTIQPGSVYVRSMQLGPQSIEGNVIDLSNGATGTDLSILVSSKVGSIAGVVVDAHGEAAGTRVVLAFDSAGNPNSRRYATAGPDGTYQFNDLAPGTYKLVAVQDSDSDSVLQFAGLDLYEDLMETVEIHPGDKVVKELKRRAPGEP